MKKEIRDGKVAVLVSPGFGAGWSTWNDREELLYHPEIVRLVEENRQGEITEEFVQKLLNTKDYICVFGAADLQVVWLDEGTRFRVDEYDGAECIEIEENIDWKIT